MKDGAGKGRRQGAGRNCDCGGTSRVKGAGIGHEKYAGRDRELDTSTGWKECASGGREVCAYRDFGDCAGKCHVACAGKGCETDFSNEYRLRVCETDGEPSFDVKEVPVMTPSFECIEETMEVPLAISYSIVSSDGELTKVVEEVPVADVRTVVSCGNAYVCEFAGLTKTFPNGLTGAPKDGPMKNESLRLGFADDSWRKICASEVGCASGDCGPAFFDDVVVNLCRG